MLAIRNLELHVAHSCNLACESCSHYSDHGHNGLLGLDEAAVWFAHWRERIAPAEFSLLGGEPTINPALGEFVTLTRESWREARIRLVTNGFLLPRHPDLPRRLAEAGNAELFVSVHKESTAYVERLEPIHALLKEWQAEFGIEISFYLSSRNWTRRYTGFGREMKPFVDANPRQSWTHCPAKYCPQLLEGALWKCAPLAYLPMQDAKFGLGDHWAPYLGYVPLRPGCSDDELHEFFTREDEPQCAMCPAAPEVFAPRVSQYPT